MNGDAVAVGFAAYVALVAVALIGVMWRWLPRRDAAAGVVVLLAWLAYAGAIAASGMLRDASRRPPGIVFLAAPALVFAVVAIARGRIGLRWAAALPLPLLLGLQVFRVGVEATLHELAQAGQVPQLLTLHGGNFEIVVALAAPLAAWLSTRGFTARRLAFGWNVVGLLSLLNVVARGVLTSPGPLNLLQADVPNRAIAGLPYSYIPGLMVPLALCLHLLAFRAMRAARLPS